MWILDWIGEEITKQHKLAGDKKSRTAHGNASQAKDPVRIVPAYEARPRTLVNVIRPAVSGTEYHVHSMGHATRPGGHGTIKAPLSRRETPGGRKGFDNG
ncbi:hypothetical protein BaRGS_00038601 [Batillaria attramentaria]|uniref:Uncharacterized protein n=1 Tax=Batillaria attramentaria TaxID=370345 RepID=A0ABD0J6S8_9CAEN